MPSAAARSGADSRARVQWLDVAKGLGIVVVVVGHALGGIVDMPGRPAPDAFREIFLAIYTFHMPLFFFLSGLLVQPRLARSRNGFAIDLLGSVAYPYFLWSIVQYSAIYAAGSLVNRPVEAYWPVLFKLPFVSISQFWFLYVLFLMHLAALLIVPRWGARNFLGLALAAKIVVPLLAVPVMLRLTMVHGVFYALGVLLGTGGVAALREMLARRLVLVPVLLLAAAASIMIATRAIVADNAARFPQLHSWEITALAWRLPVLPASLIAATGILVLALTLRGPLARLLAYAGRRTMAIFVLHVLFLAGVRIALTRHGHHPDPWLLLGACVAVGLAAPLAVHAIARRFTGSRMLGLG